VHRCSAGQSDKDGESGSRLEVSRHDKVFCCVHCAHRLPVSWGPLKYRKMCEGMFRRQEWLITDIDRICEILTVKYEQLGQG
jgi:hypothetical protein